MRIEYAPKNILSPIPGRRRRAVQRVLLVARLPPPPLPPPPGHVRPLREAERERREFKDVEAKVPGHGEVVGWGSGVQVSWRKRNKINKNRLCSKTCGIDMDFVHLGRQCAQEEKLKGNCCEFIEPMSSRRKLDKS